MKGTRHNGRSGKDGVYNPLHNDRRFDPEHSEHIDNERVRQNIYWDCYQGYLVIDKQKTSENVYFLNTVTTDDLLPLAEQGKEPPKEVTPEPEPKPTEPVEEVPEPEPEKKDSPLLSLLLIGAVVLAGGGIGYYFKIYKPKHEAPDLEDDYCEYEDGELEEIAEEPEDEDTPPWEEDTEE